VPYGLATDAVPFGLRLSFGQTSSYCPLSFLSLIITAGELQRTYWCGNADAVGANWKLGMVTPVGLCLPAHAYMLSAKSEKEVLLMISVAVWSVFFHIFRFSALSAMSSHIFSVGLVEVGCRTNFFFLGFLVRARVPLFQLLSGTVGLMRAHPNLDCDLRDSRPRSFGGE